MPRPRAGGIRWISLRAAEANAGRIRRLADADRPGLSVAYRCSCIRVVIDDAADWKRERSARSVALRCSARYARSCATTRSWSSCCGRPETPAAPRTPTSRMRIGTTPPWAAYSRGSSLECVSKSSPFARNASPIAARPGRSARRRGACGRASRHCRRRTRQGGVEHPLRAEPDRDRDRMPRRRGGRAQPAAELPRVVEREALELQLGVLGDESLQQLAHGRSSTFVARRSSIAAYASAASASGSSRSNTRPGWIAPERTSGSSSSM